MKNGITEMVFILDRSGSMGGLESDTIGGFNAMIEKQKKHEGKAYVTTVLFDHEVNVLHDRVALDEIQPMTDKDYTVRGTTALIDAIGMTIGRIKGQHKELSEDEVPEHTIFVITTDGMENASKEYSSKDVKKMIEHQKKKHNWEFLFIGANIDAVETAKHFGIDKNRAVNYKADARGTGVLYNAVSSVVGSVRKSKAIEDTWCQEINEDFEKRS
ncbi:MAG: VWA domain-containing protein [Clostridia bacterium]|nr:VWA domain-containing protein [Clostridia bacterium]